MSRIATCRNAFSAALFATTPFFAVPMVVGGFASSVANAVDIVWDGGDGDWNDSLEATGQPAKWNGGQTAFDVFGRNDGWQFGSGEIGSDVSILSGNVT